MPTYDYECENGHRFDVFQSMKDEPLKECTQCGGKAKRIIGTGAGFLFKGAGFYVTEHRSKEYKDKAKSETSGGSSTSGTSSGSESKSGESKSGPAKTGESKGGTADTKSSSKPDKGGGKPPGTG